MQRVEHCTYPARRPNELARVVIESVAENLLDAVTAMIWWDPSVVPRGCPVPPRRRLGPSRRQHAKRAMVGHHDDRYEHFGWACARLDVVVNYLPARLTCLAVAVARPRHAQEVWRIVRDAPRHRDRRTGRQQCAAWLPATQQIAVEQPPVPLT
ncbi:MAG: cobalamin biosynthesis protein [Acidimicrobiales bacterium]